VALVAACIAGAALLSASALRPVPKLPRDPLPAAGTSTPVTRLARAGPSTDRTADVPLDAVAGFVARKYRVSQDATREFVAAAHREAARHGLDPLLVVAVIAVESRFNPVAQSDAGALGLMQVIPRFHADKIAAAGDRSILEPGTNIAVGTHILKDYIRRGGSVDEGLQRYNGSADDPSNAYANRVLGERQRLQDAVRRSQVRA
jgi:soluble lytic murein transglycosylase-like protein